MIIFIRLYLNRNLKFITNTQGIHKVCSDLYIHKLKNDK